MTVLVSPKRSRVSCRPPAYSRLDPDLCRGGCLWLLFLWRPQLWHPTSSFTARWELSPGAISVGGEESCAAFNANAAVSKETGKSPDAAIRLLREIRFRCLPPGSSEVMKRQARDKYGPRVFPWLMVGKIPMRPAGRKCGSPSRVH